MLKLKITLKQTKHHANLSSTKLSLKSKIETNHHNSTIHAKIHTYI